MSLRDAALCIAREAGTGSFQALRKVPHVAATYEVVNAS